MLHQRRKFVFPLKRRKNKVSFSDQIGGFPASLLRVDAVGDPNEGVWLPVLATVALD